MSLSHCLLLSTHRYVLQTFFHPKTKHAYMKTDVGGIYRRNAGAFPGGFGKQSPGRSRREDSGGRR